MPKCPLYIPKLLRCFYDFLRCVPLKELRRKVVLLTRMRLMSFVSSAGNGVYTARATQLPKMVNKMRNSKGFHSTNSMHFLRKGFFTEKQ